MGGTCAFGAVAGWVGDEAWSGWDGRVGMVVVRWGGGLCGCDGRGVVSGATVAVAVAGFVDGFFDCRIDSDQGEGAELCDPAPGHEPVEDFVVFFFVVVAGDETTVVCRWPAEAVEHFG